MEQISWYVRAEDRKAQRDNVLQGELIRRRSGQVVESKQTRYDPQTSGFARNHSSDVVFRHVESDVCDSHRRHGPL